jgi:hypothetical protein
MVKSLAGSLLFFAFVGAIYAGEVRLGVERPLTPIGYPGPSAHTNKYPPHVASNGREFFAVWTEKRHGLANVYGTRIGADGQPRDPQGIHLVDGFHDAVIASTGDGYLIAWGGLVGTTTQRLDDNGTPIAPPRFIGSYQPASLISAGSSYLLVTYEPHSGSISAVLLDRNGAPRETVWGSRGRFVASGVHNGNYVIVDADIGTRNGTLPTLYTIAESGIVTYTELPKIRNVVNLTAAFSRDGILLAWQEERPLEATSKPAGYLLTDYFGRLRTAVDFDDPPQTNFSLFPAAWWDGTEFAVIFERGSLSMIPMRISATGKVVDSNPFVLNLKYSTGATPVFASADTVQIILWLGQEFGREPNIAGRTFAGFAGLEGSETKLITYSGRAQRDVRVARAGAHEIVAWLEIAERVFVSVDGAAIPVDGPPLLVAPGTPERAVGPPAVGAGNGSFLVVWPVSLKLLAVRITFDGRIVDAVPIVLSDHAPQRDWFSRSAIAFDGTAFVITWAQDRDVFMARLPEDPSVRTRTLSNFPVDAVSGGWSYPYSPQVAWTGSEFFLAYSLDRFGSDNYGYYEYHPAAMAGLPIEPNRVPSSPTKTLFDFVGNGDQPLAMAAGGGTSTLVWHFDDRLGHGIAMAQVGDDGGPRPGPRIIAYTPFPLLPPFTQCIRPGAPAIAWNGAEFVVAWIEGVSCEKAIVRAIRISRNGDPLDDAPFDVVAGAPFDVPAATDTGTSIVPTFEGVDIVYSHDDEANWDAPRAFARSLARLPPSVLRRHAVR